MDLRQDGRLATGVTPMKPHSASSRLPSRRAFALVAAVASSVVMAWAALSLRGVTDEVDWVVVAGVVMFPIGAALVIGLIDRTRRTAAALEDSVRREEEQRRIFDTLLAGSPVGVGLLDDELRFLVVNQALADANERSIADHLGRRLPELLPTFPSWLVDEMRKVLETGMGVYGVDVTDAPSGTGGPFTKWSVTNLYPVDLGGGRRGIGCVVIDVTDRRMAEEAVEASERRFRSLVESSSSVVFSVDHFGTLVGPQPRWATYTGRVPGTDGARSWLDSVHEDDRHDAERRWSAAVTEGVGFEHTVRLWHGPTGRYRHVAVRAARVVADGRPVEWIGTVTDVDEQRRAELALEESEARFRRLISSDVIGILSGEGDRVLEANLTFLALVGHDAGELIGEDLTISALTPPEWQIQDAELFELLRSEGRTPQFEKEYFHRDGHRVPVLASAVALEREPLRWAAFVTDMSAQKAIERRMQVVAGLAGAFAAAQGLDGVRAVVDHELAGAAGALGARLLVEDPSGTRPAIQRAAVAAHRATLGNPLFMTSGDELTVALGGVDPAEVGLPNGEAWALVPVAGDPIGPAAVVVVAYGPRRSFSSADRSLLFDIAAVCSQAVLRTLLVERSAQARLGAALENMPDAVTIARAVRDDDGQIVEFVIDYANSPAMGVAGATAGEPIVFGLHPGPDDGRLFEALAEVTRTGRPLALDSFRVQREDTTVTYAIRACRFGDGYLAVARDVSEQEAARSALEASLDELEVAQRIAHVGNWRWDIGDRHFTWSAETGRILGVDPAAPPPRDPQALRELLHTDDRAAVTDAFRGAIAALEPFGIEARVMRGGDGSLRTIVLNTEIELDEAGGIDALRGTVQDVTERRSLETALALSTLALYEEHAVTDTLQRALLPAELPRAEGLEVAAHYLAAGERSVVGGDWYDSFWLPNGELALVVGDVAGHGVGAASLMSELRHGLRAYSLRASGPAEVLTWLDRMVEAIEPGAMATCLTAWFDPRSGRLRWARAGHLPFVLLDDAGIAGSGVEDGGGPPLGTGRAARAELALELRDDAAVILFTDGLVERRDENIDVGLERLRRAAADHRHDELDQLCRSLCDELVGPDGGPDDVCVLAMRRIGTFPSDDLPVRQDEAGTLVDVSGGSVQEVTTR